MIIIVVFKFYCKILSASTKSASSNDLIFKIVTAHHKKTSLFRENVHNIRNFQVIA